MSVPNTVRECARDVNSSLGGGLRENAYHKALLVALSDEGVQHTTEATIPVIYREYPVARLHPDLIVGDDERYIVELKVDADGSRQLQRYLDFARENQMDVEGGLAISFGNRLDITSL